MAEIRDFRPTERASRQGYPGLGRSFGASPEQVMLQLISRADPPVIDQLLPSPLPRSGTQRARNNGAM
jgi:hypothetical protein